MNYYSYGCLGVLKNGNLLHKWGLVETQLLRTVDVYLGIVSLHLSASNGESISRTQSNDNSKDKGSCRGREIIKSLVQRPRRSFTKKQVEEHNLGIILIVMSSLFIFCQSFKIIPDMYEIFQCHRLGKYGGHCEMKGPVGIFSTLSELN